MPLHQKAGNIVLAAFVAGYVLARVAFGGPPQSARLDLAVPFVGIALAFLAAHLLRPKVTR